MNTQTQDEEGMLISELARRANVSVRTIRFYIAEGLLPAPQSRGRFVTYGEDALLRLQVIRHLKDAYLPLREIRDRLAHLSTAEVQRLLAELEQGSPAAQEPRSSALEYIDQITTPRALRREFSVEMDTKSRAIPSPIPAIPHARASQSVERWRHYRLAPGVVLQVSDALDDANEKRLEELLQFAAKLFSSQGVKHV